MAVGHFSEGHGKELVHNRCGGRKGLERFRVIQSDPERSKTDPNLLDAVYDLIKENHAISRAELARRLETSERQVRKAIDELRDILRTRGCAWSGG